MSEFANSPFNLTRKPTCPGCGARWTFGFLPPLLGVGVFLIGGAIIRYLVEVLFGIAKDSVLWIVLLAVYAAPGGLVLLKWLPLRKVDDK